MPDTPWSFPPTAPTITRTMQSANPFRIHEETIAALQEQIESEVAWMLNDRDADFGRYKYRVGYINGLRAAIDIAEDVLKKIQEG